MTVYEALIDAHVHIHPSYQLEEFFDRAYANLTSVAGAKSAACLAVLMMTESAGDDAFSELNEHQNREWGSWRLAESSEAHSQWICSGERRILMISGCQVQAKEGLEVLLLGTRQRVEDGLSIHEILEQSKEFGALRVIPWGAGKWFGRRGRLLSDLITQYRGQDFFLGDGAGRPNFWRKPRHFDEAQAAGVFDLPGTDPLPFAHDVRKVGKMGFRLNVSLSNETPAAQLLAAIRTGGIQYPRFESLEPLHLFFWNQSLMQLRKRGLIGA